MFKRKLSSVVCGLALLGFGAAAAGCGGMAPGDYKIFKISMTDPKLSAGCYFPSDGPDLNTKSDSETGRTNVQWILTAGPDDTFFLDTGINGKTSIAGAETDDGYAFNQKTVNVDYDGGDIAGARRTKTEVLDVTMTVDGTSVTGTWTDSVTYKCTNSLDCGPTAPSCKTTMEFAGSELQDVELKHEVQ